MKSFLPRLMATITRHPRQRVIPCIDFEWNPNNWSYNLFRLWEITFGRRYGKNGIGDTIRIEGSFSHFKSDGEWITVYKHFTYENLVVHIEGMVREYFKSWKLGYRFVPVPQLAFAGMPSPIPSIFMFAIANDTAAEVTAGGTSGSYTVTGSNPCIFTSAHIDGTTDAMTGVTYNSVALTKIGFISQVNRGIYQWGLTACATGTNTIAYTGGTNINASAASYSGVKQTGLPDSSNTGSANATSVTVTTTVVAANCWLVGSFTISNPTENSAGLAAGTGTFARWLGATPVTKTYGATVDSNGTVGTGSQSLQVTWTNTSGGNLVISSFAPVAATTNASFLMFMT